MTAQVGDVRVRRRSSGQNAEPVQPTAESSTATGHRRAIVALAWPIYVELLAGVIAGIIDVAWVARLGTAPTAAVAVATNVENLLIGIALTAGGGTTVLIARRGAEGDHDGVRAAVRGGWALLAWPTALLVTAGLAGRHLVGGEFFPHDHQAARQLAGYLAISVPALAVLFAQIMVDSVFKGLGDTKTPMRLAVVANLGILVLDPLLIYGLAGLPHLGIQGAAAATVIGRGAALTVGFLLLRGTRAVASTSGTGTTLRRSALEVARVGGPMGGDFTTRMVGALSLVGIVAGFGVVAVAAYGIGVKAMYFASMAFYAIRQAATIHTARTSRDEHPAIGRHTLQVALVVGVTAAAVYASTAPWIMRLFTSQHDVVSTGAAFLRWLALYLIPLSCVIGLSGVLMGQARGGRLFAVTVMGTVALIPLATGLSALRTLNLTGVYLAMAISALLQCVALIAIWRGSGRRDAASCVAPPSRGVPPRLR